jgi:N-methylhydantoinase A
MRAAYFGAAEPLEVPVFHRADLAPGAAIPGPAIVEEKTSTLVLYPGQTAIVDQYLNIEVAVGG